MATSRSTKETISVEEVVTRRLSSQTVESIRRVTVTVPPPIVPGLLFRLSSGVLEAQVGVRIQIGTLLRRLGAFLAALTAIAKIADWVSHRLK